MPRANYDTRYAKLTWSPEEDCINEFSPISTSTTSTVSTRIYEWVKKWSVKTLAVCQRHPGGKWHWHISFEMPREYSSSYFYSKKTTKSWWERDMDDLAKENIVVTPIEEARGIGYELCDEHVIMHSDFSTEFMNAAKTWCEAQRLRQKRRIYMSRIYVIPDAKVDTAVQTAMIDYNLSDSRDAERKLIEEGWEWKGSQIHAGCKRKRYADTLQKPT